jgi:hypothetical protein
VKIKIIVLDFETPKWLRKAIAYGAPIVGILVVGGIALATPHQWKSGDPLKSTDLNGLNRATNGTVSSSVGATLFCGVSAAKTTGAFSINGLTGYPAAKALCAASTGCSSSPTAHMCDAAELSRSAQLGVAIPTGWYTSGVVVPQASPNPLINDCDGWISAASTFAGATWVAGGTGTLPSADVCANPYSVLCCD